MTTFTDPTSDPFAVGEVVTAARLKTYSQDNPLALYNAPSCRVRNTAALTIANGTLTTLTFDAERHDNASIHSTSSNNSRLVVPAGWGGVWLISANIEWAANAAGHRAVVLLVNGADRIADESKLSIGAIVMGQRVGGDQYKLAAGDYVEVQVYQNSGGNLNVDASAKYSPEFAMTWLSAG